MISETLAAYLYVLTIVTACTLSSAARQNNEACSVDVPYWKMESLLTEIKGVSNVIERAAQKDMQRKLTDMKQAQDDVRQAQDDLRQEQQDLKEHTLNRLDALDDKMEWFLSKGQQGAHPLSDRISQIEEMLNSTLPLIKDFLLVPKDCQDVYDKGLRTSGVHRISPDGAIKMDIYCEQQLDGGGWTVFQQRVDGSESFSRDWMNYKTGFGDQNRNFWLGNDNIHLLTKHHDQKLKIEMTHNGEVKYADYSTFWIGNEAQKYRLTVSGFSGSSPPGDSFSYHNHQKFSTKDQDNDADSALHCGKVRTTGWWYKSCETANLNGIYGATSGDRGVHWDNWKGSNVPLSSARMMIKRKP